MQGQSIGSPLLWAGFLVFVLAMLALDLGVFQRRGTSDRVSLREAAIWSCVWVALAGVFNAVVWHWFGRERGLAFTTGYVLEKALSVDNIFVFVILFTSFAVPPVHQRRVLFWGVLGALVLRAIFILAGTAFVNRFHWAIYVFGAILAFTGVKLLVQREEKVEPQNNPIVRVFRKVVPVSPTYDGSRFFTMQGGRRVATPLFVALVAAEATDVIFAVDSIPAVFGVTTDPFIVFTSNIFAILGLRSLYFLLAGIIDRFHYLKFGLALVLVFIGAKMLLSGVYHVPIAVSLGVIALLLAGSIAASLLKPRPPSEVGTVAAADE